MNWIRLDHTNQYPSLPDNFVFGYNEYAIEEGERFGYGELRRDKFGYVILVIVDHEIEIDITHYALPEPPPEGESK